MGRSACATKKTELRRTGSSKEGLGGSGESYDALKAGGSSCGQKIQCGKVYYTGPVDSYFADLGFDKLDYRSLKFERKVAKDVGRSVFYQPGSQVNHPSMKVNITRIVEYKHILNQTHSNDSVIFLETSHPEGEPYYPVPNKRNQDLYTSYQEKALVKEKLGIYFLGRLANYKYFNMDETTYNALKYFERVEKSQLGSDYKSTDRAGPAWDEPKKGRRLSSSTTTAGVGVLMSKKPRYKRTRTHGPKKRSLRATESIEFESEMKRREEMFGSHWSDAFEHDFGVAGEEYNRGEEDVKSLGLGA